MSNDIVTLEVDLPIPQKALTPLDVFGKENGAEPLLKALEEHIDSFKHGDLSVKKNQKEVTALTSKVKSARSMMDTARKDLKKSLEEQIAPVLAQIKVVDGEGRKMQEELARLRDKARQPLTDYKTAEAERKDALNKRLHDLEILIEFTYGQQYTSADIEQRLNQASETQIDGTWEELASTASDTKQRVIDQLKERLQQAKDKEEQDAELERLREAEKERDREDQRKETQRIADEKALKDAEDKIQEERDARIKAQRDADQAAQRERDKIAREKLEDEKAAKEREADREHRGKINREALAEIMRAGEITQQQGIAILTAIANGKVPHVKVQY